jgi:hypothetical protein
MLFVSKLSAFSLINREASDALGWIEAADEFFDGYPEFSVT